MLLCNSLAWLRSLALWEFQEPGNWMIKMLGQMPSAPLLRSLVLHDGTFDRPRDEKELRLCVLCRTVEEVVEAP
jgi:hypothetical protein